MTINLSQVNQLRKNDRLNFNFQKLSISPPEFDTKSKKSLIFRYRLHINQQFRDLVEIFLYWQCLLLFVVATPIVVLFRSGVITNMFTKLTCSGGYTYVQLAESFRDESSPTRQQTICSLGRLDEVGGQVDSLLKGLLGAKGFSESMAEAPQLRFESALALADVWALDQLWHELGFDALAGVFRRARYTTPVEHAVRVMVFNRLCDPHSKLGVLR